jgi:hypothetical protein
MSVAERFQPIIPLQQKILDRLIAQRRVDPLGAIGWKGPLEDLGTTLPVEMLYEPLLVRGMVEDCTNTELGPGGRFFVRVTDLGVKCAAFGLMMRAPIAASSYDLVAAEQMAKEKGAPTLEAPRET